MKHSLAIRRVAGVAFALAGMLAGSASVFAQDNEIVVGQLQFNPNMHPLVGVNNTKLVMLGYISRGITAAFDEYETTVCRLCSEVPTLESGLAKIVDRPDGAKGMEVTIKLREGLKWGDGVPITANDIAFTWKVANDPKIGFSNYNPWTRADKVDIVDDRTVLMHLPAVVRAYQTWDQIIPEHLERPIYERVKNAEEYTQRTLYNRDTTNPGLWNGPFIPKTWQPGSAVILEKNPYWQGPGPKVERIILAYRDNNAALLQNLLAGAFNVMQVGVNGINFAQYLEMRRQYPDRFDYWTAPGTTLERIAVNFDNKILADPRVRQAILHGIDRQAMIDSFFDGQFLMAYGPVGPGSPLYNEGVMTTYGYDPAKSKQLLAEAGWKPGSDGVCVNDAGDRLSLEFLSTAGNRQREQLAQVIQSQLRAVCIETVNRFAELREFNGERLRKRQFTGLAMSSVNVPSSASPGVMLGSNQIPSDSNHFTGNNFSGYSSPEMDAAIARIDATLSTADAKASWAEVQRIFSKDLPILPLFYNTQAFVTTKNVVGYRYGTGDTESVWSEEWGLQ